MDDDVPFPLYRDPIHDGASDPVVVFNRAERAWWMVYTQRRANAPADGTVGWVHGSALGVASSHDGGREWTYRGVIQGLDLEWGHHTYWAPEIVDDGETYHAYVTCIRGVPNRWAGHDRVIRHYTSPDLLAWTYRSDLPLSSNRVIDACVARRPDGGYRLWYKDEGRESHTWAVDSDDLFTWRDPRPVLTHRGHEGPNVFRLGGTTWMLIDEWRGQGVFRSDDLETWERQGLILDEGTDRVDDAGIGYHADVVTVGGEAFVFYFTHPDRTEVKAHDSARRTAVNVARLTVQDGVLTAHRGETLRAGFLPLEGPTTGDRL